MAHAAGHATRPRHVSGGLVLTLALTGLMLAGAAAYVGFLLWPRWPGATASPDAPSLPITVSGVVFNVPAAAIRVAIQRRAGAQDRIDLAFAWPSLKPPAKSVQASKPVHSARPEEVEEQKAPDRLFVTIAGQSGILSSAERLKTIYPRYVATDPIASPDGLLGQRFRDGSPYQGEDLFFDAGSPERFVVRCTRPGAGSTPGTCLHERRLGAADLTMRFPRDWLADWRGVASGIDRLIASLRPPGG